MPGRAGNLFGNPEGAAGMSPLLNGGLGGRLGVVIHFLLIQQPIKIIGGRLFSWQRLGIIDRIDQLVEMRVPVNFLSKMIFFFKGSDKTADWRTVGPRDKFGNPVEIDSCGHEVLDFGRMWEESSHPNHPLTREVYERYNREHGFRWFNRR